MRRFFLAACLLLVFGLGSCRCADRPEIGPVEDEEATAARVVLSGAAVWDGRG